MKGERQMHLNVNHALLNNNMWYIVIIGLKTCDLQLTCYWINKNIKSLNNVEFEIKS
jgi:hypothetical protein